MCAMAALSSCSNEVLDSSLQQDGMLSVTAGMGMDSRTAVEDELNSEGEYDIVWSGADKIYLYGNKSYAEMSLVSGAGDSEAQFDGRIYGYASRLKHAIYPVPTVNGDGTFGLELGAEYDYSSNSNAPMFGSYENGYVTFGLMTAMFRINVDVEPGDEVELTMKGVDGNPVIIAGNATISSTGVLALTNDGEKSVMVTFNETGNFMLDVPVPAGQYKGYTVKLNDAVIADKTLDAAVALTNGQILVASSAAEPETDTPDSDEYKLSTAAQLRWFAEQVNAGNTFAGKLIQLVGDIDLKNIPWTPMKGFKGIFNGNDKTISNLNVTVAGKASAGLFADGIDATIQNLTLKNVNVSGNYMTGAIMGNGSCAVIENCHVIGGTITSTPHNNDDGNHAGGIVGYLAADGGNASVIACSVTDLTISAYRDVAGIAGTVTAADGGNVTIENNKVIGTTTIIADQTVEYNESKAANASEIVGRKEVEPTMDGNTSDADVIVKTLVATAEQLQNALNNSANGQNIVLTDDITGDITIVQKPNVKITINGNNHKLSGTITIDGKSATYTTAGLTIKDLIFNAESISADACINLGKSGDNNTRYTCNVTVDNCTFDVPSAVGVKSYTGGDKNLIITGCTTTEKVHSLVQIAGIDGVLIEDCTINSVRGMNFNSSTNVTVDNCSVDVQKYAARFGAGSGGSGEAEVYTIKNSILKSACEDGDAVIILRGTADKSTLTIEDTTLEGTTTITNNATDAKVIIDGKELTFNQNDLNSALSGNNQVTLAAGNYTLPSVNNGDVTISGTEAAVITINKPNYSGSEITLNGVTVKGSGYATGIQHVNTVTYNGAKIIGEMCLYGEKVVFNNCTFELNNQYIWTYGAKEVEFNNCTFNTNGKAVLIYNEGAGANKVTVKGCTFNATAGAKAGAIANQNCAAIEIDNFQSSGTGAAHTLVTESNTYNSNFSGEWRIKNYVAGNAITVNGVEYTQIAIDDKLMTIDTNKNVTVNE